MLLKSNLRKVKLSNRTIQHDIANQIPAPISGVGIGLRAPHIKQILTEKPDIAWLELLADNHIADGGLIPSQLNAICESYPVTLHSVGLSLGSTEPLNVSYLNKLKQLKKDHAIHWLSDHLCFTSHNGIQSHDLLPLPYTEQSIKVFVDNISRVQDLWGDRILVENVSNYLNFKSSEITEIEFINEIVERADCTLLIDVNNLYVNHINHHVDTDDFINKLPLSRIKEIHLAGYEDHGKYLLDAHNNRVSSEVWKLYQQVIKKTGHVASLIEWDNDIPELSVLLEESKIANKIIQQYSKHKDHAA